MSSAESIELIRRARAGDSEAWAAICERYYPAWLEKLHGKLGRDLRPHHCTEDILQSALADAQRDIGSLETETKFFAWFSTIVRRKIAAKRRKLGRSPPAVPLELEGIVDRRTPADERLAGEETAILLYDAMLSLFPEYPDHMEAFYLRHFEELGVGDLEGVLKRSERSIYRLLEHARELLRSKLSDPAA